MLLIAFPVIYRVTRDLDFHYNAPIIVPGGVAVDLDAAARRQHEAAMAPPTEPAPPSLVQILPAAAPSTPLGPHLILHPGRMIPFEPTRLIGLRRRFESPI